MQKGFVAFRPLRARTGLVQVLAALFASLLVLPSAVQAQSQGYKFLEAIKKRDGDTVEKMLGSSGNGSTPGTIIINARDITSGDSALHMVIAQHDLKWVAFLLYKGADPNIRNFAGTTPLWLAINTGFTDAAEGLIAKGARVNDPGPAGETPLIAAVHQKNIDLIRVLIKAGADPARADNSGRKPMDYAQLAGATTIISELDAAAKAAKARSAKAYGPSF